MDGGSLLRFVDAQREVYAEALAELRAGRKRGHWMWFVFPQIEGLGMSSTSKHFAIRSAAEARDYLRDPVLGVRLRECTIAVLAHADRNAEAIFGTIDAIKLRSSMTLFEQVGVAQDPFDACLTAFFGGARDSATLRLLGAQEPR